MRINDKPLNQEIEIEQTIQLYNSIFENFDQNPADVKFKCLCGSINHFHLHYRDKAFALSDLYEKKILKKQTILNCKMGVELPNGEIVADINLYSSVYNTFKCPFCNEHYLIVYGVGEPNNNRFVCRVTGVFTYKIK